MDYGNSDYYIGLYFFNKAKGHAIVQPYSNFSSWQARELGFGSSNWGVKNQASGYLLDAF